MSGASNFDRVDSITHKKTEQRDDEQESKHKDRKLQSLHPKKEENELGFLDEENEWAAIYKYNKYLYQKEADIHKQKQLEQKKRVKSELDAQMKEKE